MRWRALLGTVALAVVAAQLPSQESPAPQLMLLKPGQHVRLLTTDGQLGEASIWQTTGHPPGLRLTPPGLRLRAADSTGTIPLTAIDSLWLRRSKAGTGAWKGAMALGIPSCLLSINACIGASEGQGCDAWGIVAGLTLAGAAVGAGVGALIGAESKRWELQYARPRASGLRQGRGASTLRLGLRLPL